MSDENKDKKDIEVVEGTGNLDISPVYEHLSGSKPKMQDEKPKNIVIPKVKKPIKKDDESDLTDDIDDLDVEIDENDDTDDADLVDDIDDVDEN